LGQSVAQVVNRASDVSGVRGRKGESTREHLEYVDLGPRIQERATLMKRANYFKAAATLAALVAVVTTGVLTVSQRAHARDDDSQRNPDEAITRIFRL
jgi:hypothetical protein